MCAGTPRSWRHILARDEAAAAGDSTPVRPPILEMRDVSVEFGRVQALRGASLEVRQGELVALIGSNGAGKTTLLETVLGMNRASGGRILFKGTHIEKTAADRNVRAGISLVPEGRGVFNSMSVKDNLLLGVRRGRRNARARLREVYTRFPALENRGGQIASTLSGGERRMLAIARGLMASPVLLMVDEPSLGLAPKAVNGVFEVLARLKSEGYTILLAEQNAAMALRFADRGYVLETGRIVLSGTAGELMADRAVRNAYLGV
jgi:branched-chain amino acid transport system ATP-binding protein